MPYISFCLSAEFVESQTNENFATKLQNRIFILMWQNSCWASLPDLHFVEIIPEVQ
jgi:hypothetical protein